MENKCKAYFWSNYSFAFRNDEKLASEYNVEGGSVLHLVLALRGGSATSSVY